MTSLERVMLLLALSACARPQTALAPQLLLYLDTDAPLPSGSGHPSAGALDVVPLFDRVRFDATPNVDAGACDCSREFDVTNELVATGAVSFGVLPPLAGHGTLRVRLFRASATVDGEPDPGSTIDVTFALPAPSSEGVVERTLYLPTEEVGTPVGTDSPVTTLPGRPDPSHVGTWAGAVRKNCATAPLQDEVCVPGGAYWMGNVAAAGQGPNSGDSSRLVVLSPFYVDATEMTVATFRSFKGVAGEVWAGREACNTQDYCTVTSAPGPNEDLPATCLDWTHARAICQSQGKDLLSEAQYEYLASGLAGQPYVWGTDVPECGDMVFERGGYGAYAGYPDNCVHAPGGTPYCDGGIIVGGLGLGGPLPPRNGSRDRLTIALPGWTGTVFDIEGNVAEFTLDAWNLETDPCWSRHGVYTNPVCEDSSTNERTNRGGDWSSDPADSLAAFRDWNVANESSAQIGFRCARASQ
jgi:formylglycine-generating enzyme required for sulfatase activity